MLDHRGEYLTFRDAQLLWNAPDVLTGQRWEKERTPDWKEAPHFTIRAVPAGEEVERLETYAAGG